MTSKTLRQRLQAQYNKLNNRIQKSIKTGRFYQYTQFKRDQLFGRLERYALQMKHLSMGLGLVAALGVATPVLGQFPPIFLEHDGAANPIDGFFVVNVINSGNRPVFVDIDNDGDYDMFTPEYYFDPIVNYESRKITYHENVGNAYVASFVVRTGALNPLDSIIQYQNLDFVDIDNDGDLDLFAGAFFNIYDPIDPVAYFENTGTAVSPNFVKRVGIQNPLDTVNAPSTGLFSFWPTLVDIDNDGDMDCFASVQSSVSPYPKEIWYYANEGTVNSPDFERYHTFNNPLFDANTSVSSQDIGKTKPEFFDFDKDGDLDALLLGQGFQYIYFENLGTANAPSFPATPSLNNTPFDSLSTGVTGISVVDIDGDSDLDFFTTRGADRFFENMDTTIVSISAIPKKELELNIYPNPTTGELYFERPIEGIATFYSVTGQKIKEERLANDQSLDICDLNNGLYFLYIETKNYKMRKKVILQK